jgi:hypothetical protein
VSGRGSGGVSLANLAFCLSTLQAFIEKPSQSALLITQFPRTFRPFTYL